METVYVTSSNIKGLIRYIKKSEFDYSLLPYYDRLVKILSTPESRRLFKYRELLSQFELIPRYIKAEQSNPKPINQNNSAFTRLIYFKKSEFPSFHKDASCKYLVSDYENFEIPVEISDSDILKYRKFFLDNKDLYLEKRDIFFARAEMKFNMVIKNVKEFHQNNSGSKKLSNIKTRSPDIILTMIDNQLTKMEDYRKSSPERMTIINKVGFGTHKAKYRNLNGSAIFYKNDVNSPIHWWHKEKNELKNLIEIYFVSVVNPDFSFKQSVLEQCNFIPCRACTEELVL